MAIRKILQLGDPLLREVCKPVTNPAARETAQLVRDLDDTLTAVRERTGYGRAIAAPQIGALQRLVLLKLPGREPMALVNPEIVRRSPEKMIVWDACLSFLFIFMQLERHREVTVRYQDLSGAWREVEAGGADDLSELLQHEIDHLDGVLAMDRVTDSKTFCSREEFECRYREDSPYA